MEMLLRRFLVDKAFDDASSLDLLYYFYITSVCLTAETYCVEDRGMNKKRIEPGSDHQMKLDYITSITSIALSKARCTSSNHPNIA